MSKNKVICIKKCSNCGADVEICHKERLNRKNIFCSKKCEGEFRHKEAVLLHMQQYVECYICGKKFYVKPSDKNIRHFCSKECEIIWRKEYYKGSGNPQYGIRGEDNASWKSDVKITNYGYRKIRVPDHPFKDCDGFVFEHRLIAEKYLLNEENSVVIDGVRYLSPNYVVHHKDGNKLNNDVENLQVMTLGEHTRYHCLERKNNF